MSHLDENTKKEELGEIEANTPSDDKPSKSKKPGPFSIGLVEQVELIVIAFAAIILIFSFLFRTCRVAGQSMENTLFNSETVIISDLFYQPERNDIIVIHQTGTLDEPIVKRVIGLPGDTVYIEYQADTMIVTIKDKNGSYEVLEEPFIKYEGIPYDYADNNSPTYVEEGTIFVMGDNRSNSTDSRSSLVGLVDQRRILGKVILRVSPFSRIGTVE